MRLSQLLHIADVDVAGLRLDGQAGRVVADSRQAHKGCCFVAVRGAEADGHRYIGAALATGASAVVCEDPQGVPEDVPCAVVRNSRRAVARLAQADRGWPARRLACIGVTGTKGKSTITYLTRAVLEAGGHKPALLGTISYETGVRSLEANNTTPGPVELADLTAEMVAAGKTHLVMEVSSHALDQDRTAGLEFAVGVFSNLSGDHIDYHKTQANYLAAKRRLFEGLGAAARAVLNLDDPAGSAMREGTRAQVIWYGLDARADLRAIIKHGDADGTAFAIHHGGQTAAVRTTLIGTHNVHNALAATGAGLALGMDLATVARALGGVHAVPGRLQRVNVPAGYQVFVDYAHTDDALDKALTAIRPLARGRVIVMFGCGGNRDRTKRPRMAKVAERLADEVVVTSDNPRNEDPQAIIDEIVTGFSPEGRRKTTVEPDRRQAIHIAVRRAGDGDLVLLAGKGHEDYQIIGKQKVHFDDTEVAAEAMKLREDRS